MNIEVIPATIQDAKSLVAIQKRAFKRLYDIYHDEGNPYLRDADEIEKWLSWSNCYVYKIIANKILAGGIAFWERREQGLPGVYYLARIFVLPEMQGIGIASTAILLCEKTVVNANIWTLDFPADQPANRRCYEKAGYVDTGERREQSGGAIILAYMEKHIPSFRDIKNHLDNSEVHKILSDCLFDSSQDGIAKAIEKYREHIAWKMYGWVENGEILGVCGFEVYADNLEILHISVAEHTRGHGIGSSMITALQRLYDLPIKAETDDDAAAFYRKKGFKTTAIQKHNVRRWTCILPTPKALNLETDSERHARIYPVILNEYNPEWPEWYAEEKANLERLLGDSVIRIQHIGSTAVPGLTAKPTVDILLEAAKNFDLEDLIALIPAGEYICLRREGNSLSEHDRVMFLKGYTDTGYKDKVFHIHARNHGDWDELHFRDYLITHPETAAEYAELKRRLFMDYEHDRDGYTVAKGEFIKEVTKKAREKVE